MEFLSWARNQWDRLGAWLLVALGALALVLGWVGVTSTPYTFEQIPYVVSGGLGGVFLLGVGAMLWISADLRDEWRKLEQLVDVLERQSDAPAPTQPPSTNGSGPDTATMVEQETDDITARRRVPLRARQG